MDDDPFSDWLTLAQAAPVAGVSRQALDSAALRGALNTRQAFGIKLVHRSELARWQSTRNHPPRTFGLSPNQRELLLCLYQGREFQSPFFVCTLRALARKGMIGPGNRLTEQGRACASALMPDSDPA